MAEKTVVVRALRTQQKKGIDTFSFFLPGSKIMEVADISRIERDDDDLKGFQRKGIKSHVKSIIEYLDHGSVLFPNAIILSLGPEVEFKKARGPAPKEVADSADTGTLHLPIRKEGRRVAWIVDGQQRSLALSETSNSNLPVPIVAFVSPDLETQRQQFILVNKAKPLPARLISELLPEVGTVLPYDLSMRKLPSELCNLLNRDPKSPFHGLIRRYSGEKRAVVTDSSLEQAILKNLRPPIGALNQYRGIGNEPTDVDAMYKTLVTYWNAVKKTFPNAWGLPPTKSRLMHSAGIRAMGILMDQIIIRADGMPNPEAEITNSLKRIEPHCCWTSGVWGSLGWRWNEVQSTHPHINKLANYLGHLDREQTRGVK